MQMIELNLFGKNHLELIPQIYNAYVCSKKLLKFLNDIQYCLDTEEHLVL